MSEVAPNQFSPPHRIETDRTVIRCYQPSDAALVVSAITNNLDHLRPWMDWVAHEPESLHAKESRLQKNRDDFNSGTDYLYGIFDPAETELIGGTGLHPRIGPDAFEIGYWTSVTRINQGIAAEASAALARVAFEICGVAKVEIRCDPANVRSSRVPQKQGFDHWTTLQKNATDVQGQPRDTMVWMMSAEDYRDRHAGSAKIRAFDGSGGSMPPWS